MYTPKSREPAAPDFIMCVASCPAINYGDPVRNDHP